MRKYPSGLWSILLVVATGLLCNCQMSPRGMEVKGKEILRVQANGVQVYAWQESANHWKLLFPEATFTGQAGGQSITGRHYEGPTWSANDGSLVLGRKIAESAAPRDKAAAIPWLLVEAVDHRGSGVLSDVTYIRRINTVGGVAPPSPGTSDGEEVRVPYSATYVFYGPGASAATGSR